jgi:2-polyprenyl-3-methyl-5-hydroxy-6-metoxy-1,4-benzoquinol methylase
MQLLKCPVCKSEMIHPVMPIKDHSISGEIFELYQCGQCHFKFLQNPPDETEAGRYYQSEDYVSHSDTRKGLINRLYHFGRQFMLKQKRKMVRKVARNGRLLDIGTGTGYFLSFMKNSGFEVTGIEVDEGARKFAKDHFGLNIKKPEALLHGDLEGRFNIITLWHVLEHIYDLDAYMKKISESLAENGTLIIAVPNCDSFDAKYYKDYWAAYDVPRHLWHFTPETMKRFAKNNNFKVEALKGMPLDPFYIAMLSEKYKTNNKFLMLFRAGIIGGWSFLTALANNKKSSSVIYFLKKV